ncbi:MAG: cytochrome c oxidase assembly protein [Parvibaculaceae bacterium]|nr:cytochrome c oxidase assembly protein [Parvibaculaceae bacterium]
MAHVENTSSQAQSGRLIVTICLGVVFGMAGLSYASVPLYKLFCQVTGYGGTTQTADIAPDVILDREMTIRFDANTSRGLAWDFKPGHGPMKVRVGETNLAYYEAHNPTDKPITGMAIFNVTPQEAGYYFTKIECFCFTEQTLAPGERVDMPVSFFIDPEIAEEQNLDSVKTITLSYTFYPKEQTASLAGK